MTWSRALKEAARRQAVAALAAKAPITADMAVEVGGWREDLGSILRDDASRRTFFVVWALLAFEWADAMTDEAESRDEEAKAES